MSVYYRDCPTVTGTTNEEMWAEIRIHFGISSTTSSGALSLRAEDLAEYSDWVINNWDVPFDKWFIWRLSHGTASYGNLPRDKKHEGKVGHCYTPCPYSTQSTDLRTRHLLGLDMDAVLPAKVTHELGDTTYYMKTAARGSKWGFECTYPGCPYFILTGKRYFFT